MKDIETRARILEKIKRHLNKQDIVLDYGCATGILTNEIAGDVSRIYGIDISSEMIRIARLKASEHHISNIDYQQSTIFDDTYQAKSFDVILGIYMLHLLDEMPDVLKRIHALLKPGGLFISLTPCLGRKSVAGIALSLIGKTGLIPKLRLLDIHDLENAITGTDFNILEMECLRQKGRQYFVVARKSGNQV